MDLGHIHAVLSLWSQVEGKQRSYQREPGAVPRVTHPMQQSWAGERRPTVLVGVVMYGSGRDAYWWTSLASSRVTPKTRQGVAQSQVSQTWYDRLE